MKTTSARAINIMAKIAADEEGIGPLERGRGRYLQKDYPGALSAFTEVCRSSFSLVIGMQPSQ
jgi:hypothetical protein